MLETAEIQCQAPLRGRERPCNLIGTGAADGAPECCGGLGAAPSFGARIALIKLSLTQGPISPSLDN